MEFQKEQIKTRSRIFMKQTRVFLTDGVSIDINTYPEVTETLALLQSDGYEIIYAECFARIMSDVQGYFVVGEIVGTKGDSDLVYEFMPRYDILGRGPQSFQALLETISVRLKHLLYNAVPLEMGKGQNTKAKRIAERLAEENPLLEDSTPIYVPCLSRKGKGGWGRVIASKTFYKSSLKEKPPAVLRLEAKLGDYEHDRASSAVRQVWHTKHVRVALLKDGSLQFGKWWRRYAPTETIEDGWRLFACTRTDTHNFYCAYQDRAQLREEDYQRLLNKGDA